MVCTFLFKPRYHIVNVDAMLQQQKPSQVNLYYALHLQVSKSTKT